MHDADFEAILVAGADLAGVRQPGFFDDRQGVHVGTNQDGGPLAVFEDTDDAGAADLLGHVEAGGPQLLCQAGGRLLFLEREFGMGMDVLVEGDQRIELGAELLLDR